MPEVPFLDYSWGTSSALRILAPVRRSEREIQSEAELRAILERERVVRIAFASGDEPYVVPLSYGFDPVLVVLYLHTAAEGRKADFAARNPRVCFDVEGPSTLLRAESACAWGLEYESVIGYGTLHVVRDDVEKAKALDCILRQHGSRRRARFTPNSLDGVTIWRLEIESMTGKRSKS